MRSATALEASGVALTYELHREEPEAQKTASVSLFADPVRPAS